MPAGKTHDRITLYLAPLVVLTTFAFTRNERLTLLLAIAFVFSGLMFGPDLDIHSCQYKRWGWLRWVWLPYRALVKHRSPLSHGFLIGTILRLVYGAVCLAPVVLLSLAGLFFWGQRGNIFSEQWLYWWPWLRSHRGELLAAFVGLELGAMSHSFSDWGSSWWKKHRRRPQKSRKKGLNRQKSRK